MTMQDDVVEDDFLLKEDIVKFAIKHYYTPLGIDSEEFYSDLKRFKYIKRLVNRYVDQGLLSERLILNHLIIVFNVFGMYAALRLLDLKLDEHHWTVVKPFLIYLKYITNIQYTGVVQDKHVIEVLRKI